MKRTVALTILGVAAATTAFGQGTIQLDNYSAGASYNQVVWDATGTAVQDPLELQLYYSLTPTTDIGAMTAGITTSIVPGITYDNGFGPGGYFTGGAQTIAGWDQGARNAVTFTVVPTDPNLLVVGNGFWQEPGSNINDAGSPANALSAFPVLRIGVVPEPTTFALAGLGAAALLIFRRRD
mgnify:CR=1